MDYKHRLAADIQLFLVHYKLNLFLDSHSIILKSEFIHEGAGESSEIFKDEFDCSFLLQQNISSLDLSNLKFKNNKRSKQQALAIYFLIRKLTFIPTVEVLDVHCRCLGLSKSEVISFIQNHNTFGELLEESEVATRCTTCLESTIALWSKMTNINPKIKIQKINEFDEIDYIKMISSFLTNFKVYKLSFPSLYLVPCNQIIGTYLNQKEEVEEKLKKKFDLDFMVQFIF